MINATSSGSFVKDQLQPDNYVARCYQMIEIGTVTEEYMGEPKTSKKVRIGWEFPTETRVFKEENGEQPYVLSKEFTLSMHEKSNLRKVLGSWRGKPFTDQEAHSYDITQLLGKTCMIQVVHKTAKNGETYANIDTISTVPKGMTVPKAFNPIFVLSYDDFSIEKFNSLPDFIKNKMKESEEYKALTEPKNGFKPLHDIAKKNKVAESVDDLPF